MKKTGILMTALVLTVFALTGCGCRNSRPAATTAPTAMTTVPTTQATTAPTTMATEPSVESTIQDGNGPISTDTTEEGNANSRSGGMAGGMGNNSGTGSAGSGIGITGSIG